MKIAAITFFSFIVYALVNVASKAYDHAETMRDFKEEK